MAGWEMSAYAKGGDLVVRSPSIPDGVYQTSG